MNPVNIDGSGGVDAGVRRTGAEPARIVPRPSPRPSDTAAITGEGRDTLEAITAFVERLRGSPTDREALVEAARERLERGELDRHEVDAAVASALLDEVV